MQRCWQHTQKLVMIGRVVSEICKRTYSQTDRQTRLSQYFAPLAGWSTRKKWCSL